MSKYKFEFLIKDSFRKFQPIYRQAQTPKQVGLGWEESAQDNSKQTPNLPMLLHICPSRFCLLISKNDFFLSLFAFTPPTTLVLVIYQTSRGSSGGVHGIIHPFHPSRESLTVVSWSSIQDLSNISQ